MINCRFEWSLILHANQTSEVSNVVRLLFWIASWRLIKILNWDHDRFDRNAILSNVQCAIKPKTHELLLIYIGAMLKNFRSYPRLEKRSIAVMRWSPDDKFKLDASGGWSKQEDGRTEKCISLGREKHYSVSIYSCSKASTDLRKFVLISLVSVRICCNVSGLHI